MSLLATLQHSPGRIFNIFCGYGLMFSLPSNMDRLETVLACIFRTCECSVCFAPSLIWPTPLVLPCLDDCKGLPIVLAWRCRLVLSMRWRCLVAMSALLLLEFGQPVHYCPLHSGKYLFATPDGTCSSIFDCSNCWPICVYMDPWFWGVVCIYQS